MKYSLLLKFSLLIGLMSFVFIEQFTQTGIASFYSSKFQGKRTASGIPYHKDSLTAAHRTLKFGTFIKVTNLRNDSTVVVKVTDRMTSRKHIIDLSYAGALQLNMVRNGIAQVRIETLSE